MGRLAFIVFIIVPLIEITLFVLIGQAIGLLPTLLGVLVTAVVGALVLRVQGQAVLAEIRSTFAQGLLPGRAIGDAMMLGIAGALLVTPGYFTDLVGLLLLVPAVRGAIYAELKKRMTVIDVAGGGSPPAPGTIDLDNEDWRRR